MFFPGYTKQLIRWKARLVAESDESFTDIVLEAIKKKQKNDQLLKQCYNYEIGKPVTHSKNIIHRSTCNCELCKCINEYVRLKKEYQRFKQLFYSDFDIRFENMFLKYKLDEDSSQIIYFDRMSSEYREQIGKIRLRYKALMDTINYLHEL